MVTVCICRLPIGDVLRPKVVDLLETICNAMFVDNEDNCLLCLKIHQDLHRAFRPALESKINRFLEFAKQVRAEPTNNVLSVAVRTSASNQCLMRLQSKVSKD